MVRQISLAVLQLSFCVVWIHTCLVWRSALVVELKLMCFPVITDAYAHRCRLTHIAVNALTALRGSKHS